MILEYISAFLPRLGRENHEVFLTYEFLLLLLVITLNVIEQFQYLVTTLG
jgi:hypothetical protein